MFLSFGNELYFWRAGIAQLV